MRSALETGLKQWCALPYSVVIDCLQEIVPLEWYCQEKSMIYRLISPLSYMKDTLLFTGNKMIETETLRG